MKHAKLVAEDRKVLGKKVKQLRREGLLPANVYGKHLNSHAVQVKTAEFQDVFKETGLTGIVDLHIDGSAKPVLIKNLQIDNRNHAPLHVDFYQVNLKEKIKAMVPVVLSGEPKAVTEKVGLLLQTVNEVEVEALPDKLPENLEVSVEPLAALDEHVTVGDLKAPEGVTVLTDASQVVAKIAELVAPEPEPEAEEAAEGEEGAEAPAEGEETTEGESSDSGEAETKSEEASE